MEVAQGIFDVLSIIVMSVVQMFTDLLNGVVGMFWETGAEGGQITTLGVIVLLGLGIGIFTFALSWVVRFIRMR